MTLEEKELAKRASELSHRSLSRFVYTETHFLTEGEQALVDGLSLPCPASFEGGYEDAERCIAVFGRKEDLGYAWESSIVLLEISPKDLKFAEDLTHRDFLGAIMNTGIRRELLGDLLVQEKSAYLFILQSMAPYLCEHLERVRHTAVKVHVLETLPTAVSVRTEKKQVVVASARVDALVCGVFGLSRSEGKALVEKEKVSIRGKIITDGAKEALAGDRISVRGYGRFYFDSMGGQTRSGRCHANIRIFL